MSLEDPFFELHCYIAYTSALFLLMQVLQYDTFCGNVSMVRSHFHVQNVVVAAVCRNVKYLTFHPGDWEETPNSHFAVVINISNMRSLIELGLLV